MDDLNSAREDTVSRLIGVRIVRPDRNLMYEMVFPSQIGWSPEPHLVVELRGPFIIEQRVIPDGLWLKVGEATDGWETLVWRTGFPPVTYDIEVDLGIL